MIRVLVQEHDEFWGNEMSRLLWPVEFQTRGSARVWLGRAFHWTLTLLAICLFGFTVATSGMLLAGGASDYSLWPDMAGILSLAGSVIGLSIFFLGRTLRFVIARE